MPRLLVKTYGIILQNNILFSSQLLRSKNNKENSKTPQTLHYTFTQNSCDKFYKVV